MKSPIDTVRGRIVEYDERRGIVKIEAPYSDFFTMCRREYREVEITLIDSRPLSDKQRRSCYAMIREIADWMGDEATSTKTFLKLEFIRGELIEMSRMFSLGDASMSLVAAFQTWLARFIVANDVPTRKPMLDYVDDVSDYIFACLIHKKCAICGKPADLHHMDAVGMGRNRDTIIHEGLEVLPLCREHHAEFHTIGRQAFGKRYHITNGIAADKTILKIYGITKGAKK